MPLVFSVLIVSFLLVLWAGKVLPRTISGISRILRLSEFITAFILVSFATSVPELFIGIFSAIEDVPSLSLGNIMGANFVNISLVVGLSALFAGNISSDGKISSRNFWLASFIALLPVLLALDGIISRGDGLLLLVIFALYFAKVFRAREYFHKEIHGVQEHPAIRSITHIMRHFSRFLFAIVVLLAGSFVFIWAAKQVVDVYFAANFVLFGSMFVAIGTTLPELMFGIRASMQGHGSAMLGNAIGTLPFNAAAVVGIVSLINPITVDFSASMLTLSLFIIIAVALFHFFVYTRSRITRKEGLVLLLLYGIFFFVMFTGCAECILN